MKSKGRYGRRLAGATVVYLNLLAGATKKLGAVDDALAERLVDHLALQGCQVKVFVEGRPSSEALGAGHHPAV